MRTMLKKGICILIMIFSLFGIVNAVYEYSCGFEEIPATVTNVYVARSSHKGRVSEKYVLEWTSKDGETIQIQPSDFETLTILNAFDIK